MKNGEIIKCMSACADNEDLALINNYTRREMKADELYTFSLVLCDNEVDRDFERFSIPALYELEKLFVGKTGICDHQPKAENQVARIYKCYVEKTEGRTTMAGEAYHRLVAKAYLPLTDSTKELILMLDSGIRKEISVGCAVEESICSICGESRRTGKCTHKIGKKYGGKLCHTVLNRPTDAYEWSFVAVPAQRAAGVIKSYSDTGKEVTTMTDILKSLQTGDDVTLTSREAEELCSYINELKKDAEIGKAYKEDMKREIVKLSAVIFPEIGGDVMMRLADGMDFETLKAFKSAYGSNLKNGKSTGMPALYRSNNKTADVDLNKASANNNSFML